MNHWQKLAQKTAKQSLFHYKIGAVIVNGGRVLSTGVNCKRYSRKTGRPWTSIHAEEKAILAILKQPDGLRKLAGSTIYVTRITKLGVGLAKPCQHCQNLIDSVGIKTIIHT